MFFCILQVVYLMAKLVLAYSGGLDTSVAIKWLQEKYGYEIITLTLNVGQNEDMKFIEEKAYKIGSIKHYSIDAVEEFVENYVNNAIKANALYQGKYPLSSALSRPLIAKYLVKIAEIENAEAVAHGCTGKGNDQVRFEATIKALNPNLKIIAPVREWNLTRDEEIEYAKKNGIPLSVSKTKPYSIDQNIWGRSIEGGIIEDPFIEPPEDAFELTKSALDAPDKPAYLEIGFRNGIPIELNGEEMNEIELIKFLNEFGGMHGIGRIDHIEDRLVGIKSREVYECPAALILIEAHKDLEKFVLTKLENEAKEYLDALWTKLVYNGLWEDPLRKDIEAFINSTQIPRVTGKVKVKMYKGNMRIIGRKSEFALYDIKLSTYSSESQFNQKNSEGFINIYSLQTVLAKKVEKINARREERTKV
jgi:argininosuccinate synthase